MPVTDRQYVTRACAQMGVDLISPKRGNPGIIAFDRVRLKNGYAPMIIDAQKWSEAKEQLITYFIKVRDGD